MLENRILLKRIQELRMNGLRMNEWILLRLSEKEKNFLIQILGMFYLRKSQITRFTKL